MFVHLDILFCKVPIQALHSFFKNWVVHIFLLLACKSSMYILNMSPFLDLCAANVFSHPETCVLTP